VGLGRGKDTVYLEGDCLVFDFDHEEYLLDAVKEIPGCRIDSSRGVWIAPRLGLMTAIGVASAWGFEVASELEEKIDELITEDFHREGSELRAMAVNSQADLVKAIRRAPQDYPGMTVSGIAELIGVDEQTVRDSLKKVDMKWVVKDVERTSGSQWTEELIIEALQKAATYHFPLSVAAYKNLLGVGELFGPSVGVIEKRFGNWPNACEAADVVTDWFESEVRNSRWTDEDLWRWVCAYCEDSHTDGTFGGLRSWLGKQPDAPGIDQFSKRLGRWAEIKAGGLKKLASTRADRATSAWYDVVLDSETADPRNRKVGKGREGFWASFSDEFFLVREISQIDGATCVRNHDTLQQWEVPLRSGAQLKAFVEKNGFSLTSAAKHELTSLEAVSAVTPTGDRLLYFDGQRLIFDFKSDSDGNLSRAMREIDGVWFDANYDVWVCPRSSWETGFMLAYAMSFEGTERIEQSLVRLSLVHRWMRSGGPSGEPKPDFDTAFKWAKKKKAVVNPYLRHWRARCRLYPAVRADVYDHPGTTLQEIATRLRVDWRDVHDVTTRNEKKFISSDEVFDAVSQQSRSRTRRSGKWPRGRLVEVLQGAATLCYPISKTGYEELRFVGEIDGPSVSVIVSRFGSWQLACEAAGIEFVNSTADVVDSSWTDADLCRYVCAYLEDPGTEGTQVDLGRWLKDQPEAPSLNRVKKSLGSWIEIKASALALIAAERSGCATAGDQ
jgi:hypothetical protein